MTNPIYPCLWFDGNAADAAMFYCATFKESRILANTPIVVNFSIFGQKFMCLNGGPHYKPNSSISFMAFINNDDDIQKVYDTLVEDGSVMMPLGIYPWSAKYGFVQDKYGIAWQIMKTDNLTQNETVVPCLLFVGKSLGKADEAINYYTNVFKPSSIQSISYYTDIPNVPANMVQHGIFNLGGKELRAMDGMGNHNFYFNEAISFVVECSDQATIDYYWSELTRDGEEGQCGWLKDKFGVSWQIIPENLGNLVNDPIKGSRVVEAFMKMKKFELAVLESV
jgi:predicted 3-demethylubiquinone-9 3-methyltransferase (glyoxalase superfamily)